MWNLSPIDRNWLAFDVQRQNPWRLFVMLINDATIIEIRNSIDCRSQFPIVVCQADVSENNNKHLLALVCVRDCKIYVYIFSSWIQALNPSLLTRISAAKVELDLCKLFSPIPLGKIYLFMCICCRILMSNNSLFHFRGTRNPLKFANIFNTHRFRLICSVNSSIAQWNTKWNKMKRKKRINTRCDSTLAHTFNYFAIFN